MALREYHKRSEFDLKSSPERLWPYIADTNRFNRDTGMPQIEVGKSDKKLRNARRKIRLGFYGLPVEWEEQPFEWVKPFRFGVERVYSKGPLARLRMRAELTPNTDGGTHLIYEVWSTPRNIPGAVAIPMQLNFVVARRFREYIRKYDNVAFQGAVAETAAPDTSQSSFDLQRLAGLKQKLTADLETTESPGQKLAVAERLVDFLEHGDDFGVARIRPYKLADDWHEPRRLVLEVCLRATRIGLLDFQWDLLCPLCRGPQESGLSLKDIKTDVHCDTCKIDFTANFDRYVELTFKPNGAVRRLNVSAFCIGSPHWTPHVVAQQLLPAGDKRELVLPLESGNYRLRALELPGSQDVHVSSEGETTAQVTLSRDGWTEETLQVGEEFSLALKNDTDAEQLLILERLEWSDQATTAAEVTALQMFRDLFATEALRP